MQRLIFLDGRQDGEVCEFGYISARRYAAFRPTEQTWVGNLTAHKNRRGMGETKKGTKHFVSSNEGQAISGRILVAEDNKTTQNLLSRFLEFLGFEVALAGNGIEALAVFIEGSFDLVLTDLMMPAMDGLSLARHIKDRSPSTPVILLTGSDRGTVRKKVERGAVDSVIFKPFRMEALQRTVQGALASREEEHGSVWVGGCLGASLKDRKSRKGFGERERVIPLEDSRKRVPCFIKNYSFKGRTEL